MNTTQVNILFLGGAKRVSLARHIIDEGKRKGLEVRIFSYELDSRVAIASVGTVIVGLRWNDAGLMADLQRVVTDNGITMVLPFVDPAIRVAAELSTLMPELFIPVSSREVCDVMFDKVLSARWFATHGIAQPHCYDSPTEFRYPVILNPRRGSASKGIIVCRSSADLPTDVNFGDYLAQDYIDNHTEITVDCYVNSRGEATSVVPRVRLETAGGEAVRSLTVRSPEVIAEARKIISSGDFRGPITIQFLKDNESRTIYVMEINPRFGGGVVTGIGAQSGILSMLLDEYLGKDVEANDSWRDNTLMVRYFNEVIFYADCD